MLKLLSIKECCEVLQLERKSVRRLIESGDLKASRVGKVYRIEQGELEAFLKRTRVRGAV